MRSKISLGSCDSVVSKASDGKNDWIKISKTLKYQSSSSKSGTQLGSENIFLIADDFSVSVTFTCKFKSEVTASSDEIKIEDINEIDGNLEQEGNWQDSIKIEYWTSDFTSKIANSEDTGSG